MTPLMRMSRSCTPWLCVIRGEAYIVASEVGIRFWGSTILDNQFLPDIFRYIICFGKVGAANVD